MELRERVNGTDGVVDPQSLSQLPRTISTDKVLPQVQCASCGIDHQSASLLPSTGSTDTVTAMVRMVRL